MQSPPQTPHKEREPAMEQPGYPAPPQNVATAPFSVLAQLFEKLSAERKQDKRRKLLDIWFKHWRDEKGYDLYPVLRLLLPQKDRERAVYGLKEKNLAKTYIKLIGLGPRDPDSIRMLNWKRPSEREKSSGDFPQVLCEVVSKRSSVIEGTLTIEELNDTLDEITKNIGKQELQSKILRKIYNNSTAEEQRWIMRIILKDMQISVKETTVFAVFHPDAQDLYNTCSDLKKVAWELWDPSHRLNADDKNIQIFQAFAPMLCKRPTRKLEETVKEMGGAEFIVEEKLDGERMQLHKRGNEYFYCSRKGKDYTYLYGKHVGIGSLTPFIDGAFDPRIEEVILDGEMLVWDPISERNLPFGTLKTAALDKSKKENNPRPCFKIFDLLFLNGQSLLNRSTAFRKKNMKAYINPIPSRIELATEYKGKTAQDIRERMEQVMEDRGEGLVIKHPQSKYVLNGRNADWIKVKPEYMDNMGETVDVLVVAANYGKRKGGGVSTLICAVYDDRRLDADDDPKYSTFVRIGTGLSFADYVWVRAKPWKPWDPKNPPDFLQIAKRGQEDKGDVYLEPEDSFILKVKAAEITPSDQYHMGYTMRFPRALAIRDDLTMGDCMTSSAVFENLRSERKRKMAEDTGIATKKRKTAATPKTVSLLPEYTGQNMKKVAVKSDLFDGMIFAVVSDPKSKTGEQDKIELMKRIKANGGKCLQIAGKSSDALVVYGGSTTPYDLKLVIKKGVNDVIKPSWINDSIQCGTPAPFSKKYFFHATEHRMDTDEYEDGAEDDDQNEVGPSGMKPNEDAQVPVAPDDNSDTEDDDAEEQQKPRVKEEETEFDDWFRVGPERSPTLSATGIPDDSATENDSDNDDMKQENVEDGAGDFDDWFEVAEPGAEAPSQAEDASMKVDDGDGDAKMGETDEAMDYDPDVIFRHLCFYLDTPENAKRHGMSVRGRHEKEISASFEEIVKLITDNGGKIADLDEPKLTHIVLDKRDDSRRVELMKLTSKPRRRHLVLSEYVQACLDESTLLDEEAFAP